MNILCLGDPHLRFCDWDVLIQAKDFAKKHKVDRVVCMGDFSDQKSWSRFMKDPTDDSPECEWQQTKDAAKELNKMFPEMDILDGNHDRRYIKKAKEAGLVKDMIRGMDELFPYKGWKFRLEPTPLVYDNIAFVHGDELQGSVKAKAMALGMSVVQGHSHKAELHYICTFRKQIFAMDCGCPADPKAAAF